MNASDPLPLTTAELAPFLERLEQGEEFKPVLEDLLLSLPLERAEHLSLILREGRGAWLPLLRCDGGEALYIGNSFSGTVHVMAALGFRPHLYDTCAERMSFEGHRCEAVTGVPCAKTLAGDASVLPFETNRFELVVREAGMPTGLDSWPQPLAELRRVCRGELVVTVDNRLGYKRSLGRRGQFAVPSAGRFLKEFLRSEGGERTLHGYRKAMQFAGCAAPSAFSVYPHSADFTHVVGIDEPTPRLHIGPKERENRLKMAGQKLGLFPWLSPSFAIVSTESGLRSSTEKRIDRVLTDLAERSGERRGVVDEWIATRGNCVVLQTRAASGEMDDEEGRWCIHIALSSHKAKQVKLHDTVIRDLWAREASVPVPEPIFYGELQGLTLSCERRLGGLTAPQRSGDPAAMRRLLEDTVDCFPRLISQTPLELDEGRFRKHFDWRFDLVAKHAGRAETVRELQRLRDETRERLIGELMPLTLQHADLRNKHVQVEQDGRVLGYLDWGSSRAADVPYFDLLQLVVHETKQARGGTIGEAWHSLMKREETSDWESAALERYALEVGISTNFCEAIERAFPVFVAAMAESHWDYSRPRWVHHSFGI